MGKTSINFKKEIEESGKRRGILEVLLYSSRTEDQFIFPTIKEYIFNEIIRGTVGYVTGKESNFVCHKSIDFEPKMWDYFIQEIREGNRKLDPRMEKSLLKLLKPRWSSDQWGDGEYKTELYHHFKGFAGGGICPVIMESTFSLPQSVIYHVEKEVLPSLSKALNNNIGGIGKLMRKYIERDLKYIKEHYHW